MTTKVKIRNADSHVYLYAKNWYKKTNTLNDLRKIYARRNGVEESDLSDMDILSMLCGLTFQHIKNEMKFGKLMVQQFYRYKNKKSIFPAITKTTNIKLTVRELLNILRFTQTNEKVGDTWNVLILLDEPDYTILPPKV